MKMTMLEKMFLPLSTDRTRVDFWTNEQKYIFVYLLAKQAGKTVPVLGDAGLRPTQAVLTWAAWEKSLVYGNPPPPPPPHTAQSVLGRESEAPCVQIS